MYRRPIALIFFISIFNFSQAQQSQAPWQQRVNYRIDVKLDDVKHVLEGFETIEYFNNSPTDLNEIYFHLWPNAYKNRNTAFARQKLQEGKTEFHFAPDSSLGDITGLDFKVDGVQVSMKPDEKDPDICRLILNTPLRSGSRITITTPFKVRLPAVFSRLGHEGQSYQISQWYPKPAVYDVNGWNPMPYLDQGEFYSEYGSFDVSITVPSNYIVASTGVLQNPDERKWLDDLSLKVGESYDPKGPAGGDQKKIPFPESASTLKTLRYLQDSIHDFAWFADKRYNVAKSSVTLPVSGRIVESWVFSFGQMGQVHCGQVNQTVLFYSAKVGEYPYAHATVVQGALKAGGGMEYPMVTVISSLTEEVIVHEVGHNWFYGILGSNERRFPWMDEGINSFYDGWFMNSEHHSKRDAKLPRLITNAAVDISERALSETAWRMGVRKNEDQPASLHSADFSGFNYFTVVYGKTAWSFEYLKSYLGEEEFNRCMHEYFDTWKFRHPLPGDIRKTFETVSGKNLSWFFDELLGTTKQIDYKIVGSRRMKSAALGNYYELTIKNKGEIAAPFQVAGMNEDSVIRIEKIEGFTGTQTINITGNGSYDKFRIDPYKVIPEVNRQNNTIRSRGVFRKIEPLSILPLGGLDNPFRSQLSVLPLYGWNHYNRGMLGLGFHNITAVRRKVEYIAAPLYSFHTKDVNGYLKIARHFLPKNAAIKHIEIGANTARFSYNQRLNPDTSTSVYQKYQRITPYVRITLKESNARSSVVKSLRIAGHHIFDRMRNGFNTPFIVSDGSKHYVSADFTYEDSRAIDPFQFRVNLQKSFLKDEVNFVKLGLEGTYKIGYGRPKKFLEVRAYAGKLFYNGTQGSLNGLYNLRLTGNTGRWDYLYEEALMGRSELTGRFGRQVILKEGGFKTSPSVAFSDDWILALNFKSSVPKISFLKLYADIGTYADAKNAFDGSQAVVYTAGIMLSGSSTLEVYFPLISSSDIEQFYDVNNFAYRQKITFKLDLNSLDPVKLIRNIKLL
jgi:hypothetical protein